MSTSNNVRARHLLYEFLRGNGLSNVACARAIGVSCPTVHDWLKGVKRPIAARRKLIAKWTRNAVPVASWASKKEDDLQAQTVVPYSPARKKQ
jgi:hypothetical protein